MHALTDESEPLALAVRPALAGDPGDALLDELLCEAGDREFQAISIEPDGETMVVRGRAAGRVREMSRLSRAAGTELIAAVKRRAALNADDHCAPQAGTAWLAGGGQLTVATVPCRDGEHVALRFPALGASAQPLLRLGLPAPVAAGIADCLRRRGTLIIVAGPPGSGRSTTIRAMLALAAAGRLSVLRIGSGGEVPIAGVGDYPAGKDVSHALALRTVLTLDPDLIGIDCAVDRTMLAHALAATERGTSFVIALPVNGAPAALAWLRSHRFDGFALAHALGLVLAQQLVDRLCSGCRRPVQASGSVSARLGFDPGAVVFEPTGCAECDGTGFAGRAAVFEAMAVDSGMRRLIFEGADETLTARHAFVAAPRMSSAARALVREGITTTEEAVRIGRAENAVVRG